GAESFALAAREKRPFFAAVSTASRLAATHMPRPGSLRPRSGTTWPSGPATKRMRLPSSMTSPETRSRRWRSASAFVLGFETGIGLSLFNEFRFRLELGGFNPAHGDTGAHDQALGVVG